MPRARRKKARLTDAEFRRRQTQEERRQARKKRRRWVYTGVAATVGILMILSFIIPELLRSTPNPEAYLPGYATEMMESRPIAVGEEHEPYVSTPPTSGPYYDDPAGWGIHDEELPDEQVLRNLYLTGVAISYNLEDSNEVERLKRFVQEQSDYPCYVILQPYSKIDPGMVAAAAWGRLDLMEGVDEQRLQEFIDAFHGNGDRGLEKPACSPEGG